jgi:hypothetical protein
MTAATPTLATMNATTVTRQLIKLAEAGGLHPRIGGTGHGAVQIVLDGHGRDALFGAIYVGTRTGRVLRAYLTHGNHGIERKHVKVAEIRTVLKSWAAIHRDRSAAAGPHNHYGCRGCDGTRPLTLADKQVILGKHCTQYDETTGLAFCTDCLADLPASGYHAGFHVCGQQTAADIQLTIERAA